MAPSASQPDGPPCLPARGAGCARAPSPSLPLPQRVKERRAEVAEQREALAAWKRAREEEAAAAAARQAAALHEHDLLMQAVLEQLFREQQWQGPVGQPQQAPPMPTAQQQPQAQQAQQAQQTQQADPLQQLLWGLQSSPATLPWHPPAQQQEPAPAAAAAGAAPPRRRHPTTRLQAAAERAAGAAQAQQPQQQAAGSGTAWPLAPPLEQMQFSVGWHDSRPRRRRPRRGAR